MYNFFFVSDQMRKTQVGTNITEWMTIIFKTKNDLQGNLMFNLAKFEKYVVVVIRSKKLNYNVEANYRKFV